MKIFLIHKRDNAKIGIFFFFVKYHVVITIIQAIKHKQITSVTWAPLRRKKNIHITKNKNVIRLVELHVCEWMWVFFSSSSTPFK